MAYLKELDRHTGEQFLSVAYKHTGLFGQLCNYRVTKSLYHMSIVKSLPQIVGIPRQKVKEAIGGGCQNIISDAVKCHPRRREDLQLNYGITVLPNCIKSVHIHDN